MRIAHAMSAALLLLVFAPFFTQSIQYCAHFPGDDGFMIGYYKMTINDGRASHSFALDLSVFKDSSDCDLSNGLYYHIHTSWSPVDSTRTSGVGAIDCGATVTGGHYDPNLACSASSQDASGLCIALNRTSAFGYTYNCTSAAYVAGTYSHCEVGDLSGKFGITYPRYEVERGGATALFLFPLLTHIPLSLSTLGKSQLPIHAALLCAHRLRGTHHPLIASICRRLTLFLPFRAAPVRVQPLAGRRGG